jgi:hypothetical protein
MVGGGITGGVMVSATGEPPPPAHPQHAKPRSLISQTDT